jgi:hypothetical protein
VTAASNICKFEGQERDPETGNDDFGARYYSNRRVATRLITCAERGAAPFGFCFSKGAGFDFSSFLTLFTANPKSIRIVTTTQ